MARRITLRNKIKSCHCGKGQIKEKSGSRVEIYFENTDDRAIPSSLEDKGSKAGSCSDLQDVVTLNLL